MQSKKMSYKIWFIILANIMLISNYLFADNNIAIPKQLLNPKNLPLEYKIGQMLMVGIDGDVISEEIKNYIKVYNIGGVILFNHSTNNEKKGNLVNPKQLEKLTSDIQNISRIKLFISIDQEGGKITRLKEADKIWNISTPSHKALGDSDNQQYIYDQAFQMALSLASYGINMNFAPVVDVNVNPDNPIIAKYDRSFSSNPNKVIRDAKMFIKGQTDAGIISVIKHFPGHGSSATDSHLGTVDVTNTYQDYEIKPFKTILTDPNYKGAVMSAHIFNKNIDDKLPASLSYNFITKILREEFKFDGVVFSDDLKMKAIEDNFTLEEALVDVVNSGSDVIIYSNQIGKCDNAFVKKAVNIIAKNVKEGKIPSYRIDESYLRIIKLKQAMLYNNN